MPFPLFRWLCAFAIVASVVGTRLWAPAVPARIIQSERPHDVAKTKRNIHPYAEIVESVSQKYGVDPRLVFALIEVESSYRSKARSRRGATGLMQLMPATVQRYAVADPFEPEDNIEGGTRYLRSLLDEFGTKGALAAYNAGEGAVRKFHGIPPYPETRRFVSRVLAIVGEQSLAVPQ